MISFFIIGALSAAVFAAVSYVSVKRHEKHDRVLFSFSRLQSAVMKEVLARHDSGELTRREFDAAKFLLEMLDTIALHYDRHKTTMFNLRKMRQMIEQDLECFEEVRQKAEARLAEVPAGTKIHDLYAAFARASANAILAYTPFIRTEIILRLLWGDIAERVVKIRKEWETAGNMTGLDTWAK